MDSCEHEYPVFTVFYLTLFNGLAPTQHCTILLQKHQSQRVCFLPFKVACNVPTAAPLIAGLALSVVRADPGRKQTAVVLAAMRQSQHDCGRRWRRSRISPPTAGAAMPACRTTLPRSSARWRPSGVEMDPLRVLQAQAPSTAPFTVCGGCTRPPAAGSRRGRGTVIPNPGGRLHGAEGSRRQGAVERYQSRLSGRGGDHVPGLPGASPVPAPAGVHGNVPRNLAMHALRPLPDPTISGVSPDPLLLAVQKPVRRHRSRRWRPFPLGGAPAPGD